VGRSRRGLRLAADRGNIYVGENFDARRFQRFLYRGIGTPKPGTNPPTIVVR
jgi:hypothetical protein